MIDAKIGKKVALIDIELNARIDRPKETKILPKCPCCNARNSRLVRLPTPHFVCQCGAKFTWLGTIGRVLNCTCKKHGCPLSIEQLAKRL